MDQAWDKVRTSTRSVLKFISGFNADLSEFTQDTRVSKLGAEFGIKFDAEAGAILAKTSVGSHIKVYLEWERE